MFLALGIGVLLGVAIGENGIVSGASKDLEKSLRGDLDNARSRNADLRRELAIRDDYERQTYPAAGRRTCCPDGASGSSRWASLPGGYARPIDATRSSRPGRPSTRSA